MKKVFLLISILTLALVLVVGLLVMEGLDIKKVSEPITEAISKNVEVVKGLFNKAIEFNENYSDVKPTEGEKILSIGVISDTHGDTAAIKAALLEMNANNVDIVIHLGDFTSAGESTQFKEAFEALEKSKIPFYVLPGDHDYNWFPEYSRENFEKYFGKSYNQVVTKDNVRLVLYENSIQSKSAIGDERTAWLRSVLNSAKKGEIVLFFSARPLYSPYFASKNDIDGGEVMSILSKYGVEYAFAGDTHIFARYKDQESRIDMTTVGALGKYKNPLQQWVLVEVFDNGNVKITPKPLANF